MKLIDIFNIKNISNFIEGNAKYIYNEFIGLPQHIREQVLWRMSQCKDDCIIQKQCKYCGCEVPQKLFVNESCNNGERFPNLMNEEDWKKYKIENFIDNE